MTLKLFHPVPWHQVELAAVNSALSHASNRHGLTKVHVDTAIIFTEDLPGFKQSLQMRRERVKTFYYVNT